MKQEAEKIIQAREPQQIITKQETITPEEILIAKTTDQTKQKINEIIQEELNNKYSKDEVEIMGPAIQGVLFQIPPIGNIIDETIRAIIKHEMETTQTANPERIATKIANSIRPLVKSLIENSTTSHENFQTTLDNLVHSLK